MKKFLFLALLSFASCISTMEQETQLPEFKYFTLLPRELQVEIVLLSAGVPHARDNSSLRQIIHFLRTSRMRYYNNAEFTEELLKNLYQKQQKKRFREGLSFAHIAANLRTPIAGCALKNYLIAHPQERDEVERIFYYNMELDRQWLKVLADSGININTGIGGENALLGWARSSSYVTAISNLLSLGADINSTNKDGNDALMLLIKNHGDAAFETAKYLLESGIGFHMNKEDQSAISIARDTHSIAVFSLFERHIWPPAITSNNSAHQ